MVSVQTIMTHNTPLCDATVKIPSLKTYVRQSFIGFKQKFMLTMI